MNSLPNVPPGFRFHPTEEELVHYYLRKKISSTKVELDVIRDVDLYKIEPWDLQEICRIGTQDQNEWYFYSHKDKKYPTGTRTNRATSAGFWKATGRDKTIYAKLHGLIGMRKTLVFYKGRAPNGLKSDWIMHEYRLLTHQNCFLQEEGWVVCRVFKKKIATLRKVSSEHESPYWYHDDQLSIMPNLDYTCKKELALQCSLAQVHHHRFLQVPLLESPTLLQPPLSLNNTVPSITCNSIVLDHDLEQQQQFMEQNLQGGEDDQVTADWRFLDKLVPFQGVEQENDDVHMTKQQVSIQNAETSTRSCYNDQWN